MRKEMRRDTQTDVTSGRAGVATSDASGKALGDAVRDSGEVWAIEDGHEVVFSSTRVDALLPTIAGGLVVAVALAIALGALLAASRNEDTPVASGPRTSWHSTMTTTPRTTEANTSTTGKRSSATAKARGNRHTGATAAATGASSSRRGVLGSFIFRPVDQFVPYVDLPTDLGGGTASPGGSSWDGGSGTAPSSPSTPSGGGTTTPPATSPPTTRSPGSSHPTVTSPPTTAPPPTSPPPTTPPPTEPPPTTPPPTDPPPTTPPPTDPPVTTGPTVDDQTPTTEADTTTTTADTSGGGLDDAVCDLLGLLGAC